MSSVSGVMKKPKVHDYRNHRLKPQHELKRFEAVAPGRYLAEGIGGGIEPGDRLWLSLKGAQSLHLELEVEEIRYKIIPERYWVAQLTGEDFDCLLIQNWAVICDLCRKELRFEFAVLENDPADVQVQKASARIRALGWQPARSSKNDAPEHICPDCLRSTPQ